MGSKKTKAQKVQVADIIEKDEAPTVTFDSWFFRKMRAGLVRAHQHGEIRSYFMQKGLKHSEQETVFNEALKTY